MYGVRLYACVRLHTATIIFLLTILLTILFQDFTLSSILSISTLLRREKIKKKKKKRGKGFHGKSVGQFDHGIMGNRKKYLVGKEKRLKKNFLSWTMELNDE